LSGEGIITWTLDIDIVEQHLEVAFLLEKLHKNNHAIFLNEFENERGGWGISHRLLISLFLIVNQLDLFMYVN